MTVKGWWITIGIILAAAMAAGCSHTSETGTSATPVPTPDVPGLRD